MSHFQNNTITPKRRAELADLVGLFGILIEEDKRQRTLQHYEHLNK